jgi:type VI secretion system protein ImpA
MTLPEELLQPIDEDRPSGVYLRHDPAYDEIKEARREDDVQISGVWRHEAKAANPSRVISLTTSLLKHRSKDLQIAAWLTEALLRKDGFAGLAAGLRLLHELLERFWDTLYPEIDDDGDCGLRIAPFEWIAHYLDDLVRTSPLDQAGHGWYQYMRSRGVMPEDQVQSQQDRRKREAQIKEGALPLETVDRSIYETPRQFYVALVHDLDECLDRLRALNEICDARFGFDESPSFQKLNHALTEVRHVAARLLANKTAIAD